MTQAHDGGHDVLVIGGGAAGAAVSLGLAEHGLKVLCLEQGDWIDRTNIPKEHLDWEIRLRNEWSANPNQRKWKSDYSVRSVGETPVRPSLFNAVGGSTLGFGGMYWRLLPSDFRTKSLDDFGVDWPITYEDLAPYYRKNELILGISGLSGDPTAPDREEMPFPPPTLGKIGRIWAEGFEKLGWYWWTQDSAATTGAHDDREECVGRGFCNAGCPGRVLVTVDVTYWPRALKAGVELRTNARVREILVDNRGRATGALYYDANGDVQEAHADVVVVSGSGIGTPRLLLMSKSAQFPDGLANSSGLVGKNLMLHTFSTVIATFDEQVEGDSGAWGVLCSREFYETDRSRGYVRGFSLGTRRGVAPLSTALALAPWGADHHNVLERHLNHEASMQAIGDDEPMEINRVELDWGHPDNFGLPGVDISYQMSENSKLIAEDGARHAKLLCEAAGATSVRGGGFVPMGAFHLMGTARMGDDPRTSVVNSDNRAHDVPNLFIVDGSSMPTGGAVNPTNTIQALALRTADRIYALRSEMETPN